MLKMRSDYLLRSNCRSSSESDSDSDSNMKDTRKRVQFSVDHNENPTETTTGTERRNYDKTHRRTNSCSVMQINRGDIPDGSDIFRQVLKEIQTPDGDKEELTTLNDNEIKLITTPPKSILKRR